MHKGIILIVKADDKDEARSSADSFMEGYQNDVWDWYVIGGRWSGLLTPTDHEFNKRVTALAKKESIGLTMQDICDQQDIIQRIREDLGNTGNNPYSHKQQYAPDGLECDIMPLGLCVEAVKKYGEGIEESIAEDLKRAEEWKAKGDKGMYGYSLKCAGKLLAQDFCFDCNVYNVEDYGYSIPEDTDGYFAVVVDIHN